MKPQDIRTFYQEMVDDLDLCQLLMDTFADRVEAEYYGFVYIPKKVFDIVPDRKLLEDKRGQPDWLSY